MTKGVLPYQTAEFLRATGKSDRTPMILGDNIGFQTGSVSNRPKTGVVYMTIGVLHQQLKIMDDKKFMMRYSLIVIDECHIRSSMMDFTLFMLKNFINKYHMNVKCPFVIVTSATFPTIKYTNYMLSSVPAPKRYKNIIKIEGSVFPVKDIWPEYDIVNYIEEAVKVATQIHRENINDFLPPEEVIKSDNSLMLSEDLLEQIAEKQKFRDILIFVGGTDGSKIIKKIEEITTSKDVEHYKNLRKNMKESKRVHIRPFVLIFSYDVTNDFISFEDFDHHDHIYS
jgi:HrpA-like RNA helicase